MTASWRSDECVWSGALKPALNLWNAEWAPFSESPRTTAIRTSLGAPGFGTHFSSSGVVVTSLAVWAAGFAFTAPVFASSARPRGAKRTTTQARRIVLSEFFMARLLLRLNITCARHPLLRQARQLL